VRGGGFGKPHELLPLLGWRGLPRKVDYLNLENDQKSLSIIYIYIYIVCVCNEKMRMSRRL